MDLDTYVDGYKDCIFFFFFKCMKQSWSHEIKIKVQNAFSYAMLLFHLYLQHLYLCKFVFVGFRSDVWRKRGVRRRRS